MNAIRSTFWSACRGKTGFTLIDVMMAMGLGSIAIVTTLAVIGHAERVRRIENLRNSVVAVREQIIKNLARYDNFQETIHNNTVFSCLQAPNRNCGVTNMAGWEAGTISTARGGPTPPQFNLMVSRSGGYVGGFTSEIFYEGSNLNAGFTDDGLKCLSASPAPNQACPIRADLYWWSLCSGTCNPGMIGIKVVLRTYNHATKQTITTPYGFNLIKAVFDDGQQGPFPTNP